jgi:two-component system, NtrC family, nitrogen regulation response regulator NtrX
MSWFLGSEEIMAKVLVVDDECENVELLRDFLVDKGYEVVTASDGGEALRKVKEGRPHVILLDICMPGMDGLEVLRRVQQIDQRVGIIMVTGVNEEEVGRRSLKMGAFDYITKPIDLQYLEQSLWTKTMLLTL